MSTGNTKGGARATSTSFSRSSFLAACRCEEVERTPVWIMRQAGRYLPEYRALREKHSMMEMIASAELAAEVTLQPLRRFDLDAAILFSDILPPLAGMGLELEFVPGIGPKLNNPISSTYDIDVLAVPPAAKVMAPSIEAARNVSATLSSEEFADRAVPLIGFAGAPFTLASYAVEGGGSKEWAAVKALMYSHPAAWKRLMTKLVTLQADYLREQAAAGARALMVFDSWAGLSLGPDDYARFVAPYTNRLLEALADTGVPRILYVGGTSALAEQVAAHPAEVFGIDHRCELRRTAERIIHARVAASGPTPAIQGNLDPIVLQAPWRELRAHINGVLDNACGLRGHIFNLGHGIHRATSPDAVRRLVDYVHGKGRGVS